MSTWLQDLKKSNPKLAEAYAITGNQDYTSLRNMVKALKMLTSFNTEEDNKRLQAAEYILNNRSK